MFKQILVPVDFSERAKAAFGHGALFATAFRASLELLHVIEDAPHQSTWFGAAEYRQLAALREQALKNAEASLRGLISDLHIAQGAPVATSVEAGEIASTIATHAKRVGTELIVTATHGRTGLSHLLMGSVCERILRHAPCPVLVARGTTAGKLPDIRNVVVAVDLSEHSKRALDLGAATAAKFGASLDVLHSWEAPYFAPNVELDAELFKRIREGAQAELRSFLDKCDLPEGLNVKTTELSGGATATINDYITAKKPDLLVMGTHGRSGFKHMILGSVAETVIRYAPCPTLVVP